MNTVNAFCLLKSGRISWNHPSENWTLPRVTQVPFIEKTDRLFNVGNDYQGLWSKRLLSNTTFVMSFIFRFVPVSSFIGRSNSQFHFCHHHTKRTALLARHPPGISCSSRVAFGSKWTRATILLTQLLPVVTTARRFPRAFLSPQRRYTLLALSRRCFPEDDDGRPRVLRAPEVATAAGP